MAGIIMFSLIFRHPVLKLDNEMKKKILHKKAKISIISSLYRIFVKDLAIKVSQ